MGYEDCIFIRNVYSAGKSSYENGCKALNKRFCLHGEQCKFYKSTAEWERDAEGFVQRKVM